MGMDVSGSSESESGRVECVSGSSDGAFISPQGGICEKANFCGGHGTGVRHVFGEMSG